MEAASLGAVLTAIAYLGSMAGSVAGGALSDRKGRTCAILEVSERWSRGLAWTALGAGAVLGPLMTWRLRRMPEAAAMAGGKA